MKRTAYVDNRLLAQAFKPGDVVRRSELMDAFVTPYVGRVVFVNTGMGIIDVQWPWGREQEMPVELIKELSGDWAPPEFITDYSSWDMEAHLSPLLSKRVAACYNNKINKCYQCTCKALHYGADIETALDVFDSASDGIEPELVNRLSSYIFGKPRHAIYYKASPRKYQMTKAEMKLRDPQCPKCRSAMKTARISKSEKVYRCSNHECKFMIHPNDVLKRTSPMPTDLPIPVK